MITELKRQELERVRGGVVWNWYAGVIRDGGTGKIRFQFGNKKLVDTDELAFIIFSLPAVLTCPGATGACLHNCYARRDERFTNVRRSRVDNFLVSRRDSFRFDAIAAINRAVYKKDGTPRRRFAGKKIVFRLHESGDFYSYKYLADWCAIAAAFPDIQFFTYTKSFEFYGRAVMAGIVPSNLFVRASIWDDTPAEDLKTISDLQMFTYSAVDDINARPAHTAVCDCAGGCGACGCLCSRPVDIVCEIH